MNLINMLNNQKFGYPLILKKAMSLMILKKTVKKI